MNALAFSYLAEADKIRHRGSVWVQLHSGKWYHTYNKDIVKQTIQRLTDQFTASYIEPEVS